MTDRPETSLRGRIAEIAIMVLTGTIGALTYPAAFIWIITFIGGHENSAAFGTPFTLAQVIAIFGAFGLAGGFTNFGTSEFRRLLRLMATLYLISALSFCLMGMLLPAVALADEKTASTHMLIAWLIGLIIVAAVAFSTGTLLWMSLIRQLTRKEQRIKPQEHCLLCHGGSLH